MGQLEQAPLSKSVADAFGWFFLLAALSSLVAFFVLILPVITDPESSFIYQQMSVYLSADEPLVLAAGAENQSVFTISSDGRLLITFFLAILALGAFGSFLGALIAGAVDLFYFSNKSDDVTQQ
jgi:hypothetical protein